MNKKKREREKFHMRPELSFAVRRRDDVRSDELAGAPIYWCEC